MRHCLSQAFNAAARPSDDLMGVPPDRFFGGHAPDGQPKGVADVGIMDSENAAKGTDDDIALTGNQIEAIQNKDFPK
jgi:hypothetical protein